MKAKVSLMTQPQSATYLDNCTNDCCSGAADGLVALRVTRMSTGDTDRP